MMPVMTGCYLTARNSNKNFIYDVSNEACDLDFLAGVVIGHENKFSGILSQLSLRMRKIGRNSTSGINFDFTNELCDHDLRGVISPK
jgi:hypothetical protein